MLTGRHKTQSPKRWLFVNINYSKRHMYRFQSDTVHIFIPRALNLSFATKSQVDFIRYRDSEDLFRTNQHLQTLID